MNNERSFLSAFSPSLVCLSTLNDRIIVLQPLALRCCARLLLLVCQTEWSKNIHTHSIITFVYFFDPRPLLLLLSFAVPIPAKEKRFKTADSR